MPGTAPARQPRGPASPRHVVGGSCPGSTIRVSARLSRPAKRQRQRAARRPRGPAAPPHVAGGRCRLSTIDALCPTVLTRRTPRSPPPDADRHSSQRPPPCAQDSPRSRPPAADFPVASAPTDAVAGLRRGTAVRPLTLATRQAMPHPAGQPANVVIRQPSNRGRPSAASRERWRRSDGQDLSWARICHLAARTDC